MLYWIDSFDKYGGNANIGKMLDGLYASIANLTLTTAPAPPTGTYVCDFSDGQAQLRRVFPAGTSNAGIGGRYYFNGLPGSNNRQVELASFNDNANIPVITAYLRTEGGIDVVGRDGTLLAATPGPAVTADAYQHIEFFADVSGGASACVFDIYVNNIRVFHHTNLNPSTIVNMAQVFVGRAGGGGGTEFFLKDLFGYDNTGSHNTGPIGDCTVLLELLTGNGSSQDWTVVGGGTAWSNLNALPPVDTVYIDASAVNNFSDFGFADLPTNATAIKGVQVTGRQWKSDAGAAQTQVGMLSAATQGNGANRALSTTPTYYGDIFEVDPATGSTWTRLAVNAAQVTINRTV